MRPKRLVHPSQARTIDNPVEVERLLQQGWLLAQAKPRTKDAARMRTTRRSRRAEGWQVLSLWLSPDDAAAVRAARRDGESYAALLVRLVEEQGPS